MTLGTQEFPEGEAPKNKIMIIMVYGILKIMTILTTLYLWKPLYVDLMQRIVDNLDCGKHNNDQL